MNEEGLRRSLPDQSSGSGHTFATSRHPSINDPILSKRVCFYKSGDPQFSGLRLVINNRTFKTFDALLDSLSKKVPLPFGVRKITTPRGVHGISTLDELEDGKSYICSDSRKIKPINLAQARKKLPPWYNARPMSSNRRNVQKARRFPGRSIHKREQVVVRTPKKLTVFRNGDPTEKHTVLLHKKTTPSYESILEYISQLIQFHVVKLVTPDGKRVDGLPGLILCSGTVVAVGREPFKPAPYSATKAPPSAWLQTKRQKTLKRKKRVSYPSKLNNFSASSERYVVHQIHNTMAEKARAIPTNSKELDSNRILESVAETEDDTCLGDGIPRQPCPLPNEDDIEKSFQVNQDGSMTVEMKVRLTLKEEETIHWTTTVSRSSTANNLDAACLTDPEPLACSSKSNSLDLQSPATSSLDSINKDKTKDNDNVDLSSQCNAAYRKSSNEEHDIEHLTNDVFPGHVPTVGCTQLSKKQASVESVTSLTEQGIQEQMVGSYSYQEHMGNGTMTEQYCMVKQSTGRPVPKPRRLGSLDVNHKNVCDYKCSRMNEMVQIDSSGEEVTESVLHIYEQHTCQDSFLANICVNSMSATRSRPATSENGHHYCSNGFKPEQCRPSTASESISIWKAENNSATSEANPTFFDTDPIQAKNRKRKYRKAKKINVKPQHIEVSKFKKLSTKPKVTNKHVRQLLSPGKRRKGKATGTRRALIKPKTFSSAGFLKRIYGNKQKSTKNPRKKVSLNRERSVTTNSLSDDTKRNMVHNLNKPPNREKKASGRVRFSSAKVSQPRAALNRQTSMHRGKEEENKDEDVREILALPAYISSSSVTKEYVENWLEKTHLRPPMDNSSCEETELLPGLITGPGERQCLVKTSNIETTQTAEPLPKSVQRTSVKMRVTSIETNSTNSLEGKTTAGQQIKLNTSNNTDNSKGFSQYTKPQLIGIDSKPLPPIIRTKEETLQESGEKSILLQEERPVSPLMELPPPPSAVELAELEFNDEIITRASSEASCSLYRLSSSSSTRPDTHTVPVTSVSDNLVLTNVPTSRDEASLSRVPSIKRAPLVSNLSFERRMSLRKAKLEKHTLMANAPDTSPHNVLPNGTCLTGMSNINEPINLPQEEKQKTCTDVLSYGSGCTSVSPHSLTSEERGSSPSIASITVSAPSSLTVEETLQTKTQIPTSKKAASPKTLMKKVKLKASPSSERKAYDKTPSLGLSNNYSKASSLESLPTKTTPDGSSKKTATQNVSPSTERNQKISKPKLKNKLSPYSQSLDVGSPPVRRNSMKKLLSRNLSLQNPSEPTNKKKGLLVRKSTLSRNDTDKTCDTLSSMEDDSKLRFNPVATNQDKSPEMTVSLQSYTTTNQPNIKPVLEKICYSIKSIRNITQSKQPSCLEKSNSMPDFSSHVASTFGSSSKALLAFLSVMTLKEGMTSFHMDELNANNVSCAEALKMIYSLKEIANIEDSHKLKASLSRLQLSASKQLLQSWSGFQEISNRCKSQSSIKSSLVSLEQDNSPGERAIDELLESLEVPEMLKEELASFSAGAENGNCEGNQLSSAKSSNGFGNQDNTNVDVKNIIKQFSKINQQEADSMACDHQRETLNPMSRVFKDQSGQSDVTAEELRSFIHENNKDVQVCKDVVDEKQEQKDHKEDKSIPERTHQKPQSVNGFIKNKRSARNEQTLSSANKDLQGSVQCSPLQRESDQHGSEAEHSETEQHSSEDFSDHEVDPEKVNKKPDQSYVDVSIKAKHSVSNSKSKDVFSSEVVEPSALCKKQEPQSFSMGYSVSIDESTGNSDMGEPSSEEEQPDVESDHLQIIVEENLSANEDEKEEEECVDVSFQVENPICEQIEDLTEPTEKNPGSLNDRSCEKPENRSPVMEKLKLLTHEDNKGSKQCNKLETDGDSGNNHSSCKKNLGKVQPKTEDEQISSSLEEELKYVGKESSSEEERVSVGKYIENGTGHEISVKNIITSRSVAERVVLLEQQVAESQKGNHSTRNSAVRSFSQRNARLDSDADVSSESPTSPLHLCTRSAPQSSLSFSYDSSGVITTEPESNTVRSIRQMFLAKSPIDVQPRRFQRQNSSMRPKIRTETSVSGGYQTQTSGDLSSFEDDSPRRSITKGFVRRTIERLYGKKDAQPDEAAADRAAPEEKHKKKEHQGFFSSLQAARSKAMTELHYLNSTNASETFTEATRCIAFNAQVGPEDSLSIDNGRWLLKENTQIRKSVSDPVGINKTFTNSPESKETHESPGDSTPYSLFSTKTAQEEHQRSFSRKCTYFSLPHGSDSEPCQDDVNKGSVNEESLIELEDISKDTKLLAERNSLLPAVGDIKLKDNRVHPVGNPPTDGDVVVQQPGKGQGVVNRQVYEPDMLDFLYNFCGQNCPIL